MKINQLSQLESLPSLITLYSLIFMLASLIIFAFTRLFVKRLENSEGKILKLLKAILSLVNEISKVTLLFSGIIYLLGIIMYFVIVIFVHAMENLYTISEKDRQSPNELFSMLASPLATTLSLSFTILIAVFGNRFLKLEKVREWIEKILDLMRTIVDEFLSLNDYLSAIIISVLCLIEAKMVFNFSGIEFLRLIIIIPMSSCLILLIINGLEKRKKDR